MVYATSFSFILLLGVIYIPILQPVFYTVPLGLLDWGVILSFAIIPLIISELYKALFIREKTEERRLMKVQNERY